MYCVNGYDNINESRASCSEMGLRRQAMGFIEPLRKAFSETLPKVLCEIPYSCM